MQVGEKNVVEALYVQSHHRFHPLGTMGLGLVIRAHGPQ